MLSRCAPGPGPVLPLGTLDIWAPKRHLLPDHFVMGPLGALRLMVDPGQVSGTSPDVNHPPPAAVLSRHPSCPAALTRVQA